MSFPLFNMEGKTPCLGSEYKVGWGWGEVNAVALTWGQGQRWKCSSSWPSPCIYPSLYLWPPCLPTASAPFPPPLTAHHSCSPIPASGMQHRVALARPCSSSDSGSSSGFQGCQSCHHCSFCCVDEPGLEQSHAPCPRPELD